MFFKNTCKIKEIIRKLFHKYNDQVTFSISKRDGFEWKVIVQKTIVQICKRFGKCMNIALQTIMNNVTISYCFVCHTYKHVISSVDKY